MQEYRGNAVNIVLAECDDKTLMALAEIILLTSEPVFSVDGSGELVRRREIQQTRFAASIKPLRALIKNLESYAKEMEEVEARYVAKSAEA